MTIQSSIELDLRSEENCEKAVAEFLKQHPDFFNLNPELLGELRINHPSGVAVSLIERQVTVLREQKHKLDQRIQELVSIAHENDEISRRVHQLSLKIMECRGFAQAVTAIRTSLIHEFNLDAVSLKLLGVYKGEAQLTEDLQSYFIEGAGVQILKNLLLYQEPVCGRLKFEHMRFLFPADVDRIQSIALLPLGIGVVALGSYDPHRFTTSMETHFLKHLAELIARKIRHDVSMP